MKKILKIAIFHNLPSGGAKRSLYEWVKRLYQHHTIDLYSYSCTSEEFLDIRPYINNRFLYGNDLPKSTGYNPLKKIQLFKELIWFTKEMAEDINKRSYDVVFVHHCTFVQSPLVMQYIKRPILYYCQEPFRRVYEPRPLDTSSIANLCKDILLRQTDRFLKKIDEKSVLSADLVLANSNYSKGMIQRAYDIESKTCYLGVDLDRFERITEKQKEYEVISVGRLDPVKGHDFIIKSVGMLDERIRPKVKLVCDSINEEYKEELLFLAKQLKVVCSIKQAKGEEMPGIYNKATLTVFAPHREPLGLVPLESMACGVPVVSVAEGGIKETVKNGVTGILTDRSPNSFAEAMESLLRDDEKRSSMGEAGISYIKKNWSWEVSVRNIEDNLFQLSCKR